MNKMLQDAGIEIPFDYVDGDGEGMTDYELHVMFDEWLDDVYGNAEIAGYEYQTSRVLKQVDPIAYRVGFSDWISFQIEDGMLIEV